ncbi:GL25801 [Drosophila persimilis]|uniref:GL25801 n=1 Tax=Drosophila persimilis TaxID=7234 RepID=B4GUE7_DROPE|nr:GL25801 [Drosophila persimilis]
MERNHKKGGRILVERQQRLSMQNGNCFYIRNTQTQVREVLFRTADNLGVDRGSLIKVPDRETQARERQHMNQLNRRIKYEIDQLKFLRRNIIQNPVEYKASESYMELHDKEFSAEESSDESQSCDTGDQRIIQTLSCTTVLHTNKRCKRAEGGCNYIPRQRNKCRDLEPRSVHQCDYGNSSRCIACFAGAQQQLQDDNNNACCTLQPSVESYMELHDKEFSAEESSDESQSCDTGDQRIIQTLSCTTVSHTNKRYKRAEGGCNYIPRQRNKCRDLEPRSVYQCDYGNSSRCIAYFADAQQQFQDDNNYACCRLRPSVPIPVVPSPCWKEIDEQADNTTKSQKFFEYMDKYENENENGDAGSEQGKAGEGSQLESNPTYTRIPHIKREPGESKYDEIAFTPDKNKESACLDSCPAVNCKPPQSAYEERGVCDKEKCVCVGQKDKTEAEYKYQHPAQDDGREPKSGEEGVCVDSCPGGTFKPPKSAYDEGVPISTADKIAERGEAVSHKEKCPCVTQEVQTDDEFVKKETRLTQTDLKLLEEQLTQTDPQGSQHEGPAQTDMGGSRLDMLTKNDLQGSQQESVPISRPDETEGTCKPLQSAYDERDQISTSNKRVEKDRVRRNLKCDCRAQEVQNDEELSKKVTRLTQTDLKALEEQVTQTDPQGSRQETVPQTDVQGSQHDGITQADLQGRQHERLDQNDLQENQYKGLVQTEPEINQEIGSGKSAISGVAVSKAEQFSTWSPNDDTDVQDVQTASQKEKKQNQRQDSPSALSRKIYSAQSPSSQKYMKYISRGSLTEQSEQDADAEHRSNSRRYPAKQCQCKPVSSGPSQQTQVLEEPKEQQYLDDDEDIPVGTACPLKKSSPFCDPLPPAAKCDLHPAGCYCDTNQPKVEKPKTSGRAKHTERSRKSSPTNTKSQQKGPDNTKQYQQYESTYQYSYGRSEDAENVDSSGTGYHQS